MTYEFVLEDKILRLFFNYWHWDWKELCQAICYLFRKLNLCFQLLNSKNDGPVLLFKTIINYLGIEPVSSHLFTEFTTAIHKYFVSVCMHNNALNLGQLEWCNERVWCKKKLWWHLWTFFLRIILININPDDIEHPRNHRRPED